MVYGTQLKTFKDAGAMAPGPQRGAVMREFDDNLIFEGEVVGAPVIWTWASQAIPAVDASFRFAEEPEARVSDTRLAA